MRARLRWERLRYRIMTVQDFWLCTSVGVPGHVLGSDIGRLKFRTASTRTERLQSVEVRHRQPFQMQPSISRLLYRQQTHHPPVKTGPDCACTTTACQRLADGILWDRLSALVARGLLGAGPFALGWHVLESAVLICREGWRTA